MRAEKSPRFNKAKREMGRKAGTEKTVIKPGADNETGRGSNRNNRGQIKKTRITVAARSRSSGAEPIYKRSKNATIDDIY
jgi:hypothetical protein